jgi:hypothetical protein
MGFWSRSAPERGEISVFGVKHLRVAHRPPRAIASVGHPEAGESLIRQIVQRRLLVGLLESASA